MRVSGARKTAVRTAKRVRKTLPRLVERVQRIQGEVPPDRPDTRAPAGTGGNWRVARRSLVRAGVSTGASQLARTEVPADLQLQSGRRRGGLGASCGPGRGQGRGAT